MTQNQYHFNGANMAYPPSTVSPLTSTGHWGEVSEPLNPHHMSPHQSMSVSRVPPTELPAEQYGPAYIGNEVPHYVVGRKTPGEG